MPAEPPIGAASKMAFSRARIGLLFQDVGKLYGMVSPAWLPDIDGRSSGVALSLVFLMRSRLPAFRAPRH